MGPADSVKVSRDSTYSGYFRRQIDFAYGTFHRSKWIPLSNCFLTPCESPTTPEGKSLRFGLFRFRSPLLTESIFLSFPLGTEMFQFSRLAAQTYGLGLRLFGNLRIKACLTTPRSFSQFSAPFKAFRRQDVPHALFLRLIAPIHHSLRNNRIGLFSVLSIYYRNVFSTPREA